MDPSSPHRLPPGFRVGTVAARTLRHLVPPDGRFGICGAPVAAETIATSVAEDDRVCDGCIDRLTGGKPFVPQPPAKQPRSRDAVPKPPASVPETLQAPRKVTIELPRRVVELLEGVVDLSGVDLAAGGGAVRCELAVAEAQVVADVLQDMGERRESARVRRATQSVPAS